MDALEALTTFDWITRLASAVKVAAGFRGIFCAWSENPPVHYQRVLRKKGIRADMGGIVPGEGFILLVPKDKVATARRILSKAGAALAYHVSV